MSELPGMWEEADFMGGQTDDPLNLDVCMASRDDLVRTVGGVLDDLFVRGELDWDDHIPTEITDRILVPLIERLKLAEAHNARWREHRADVLMAKVEAEARVEYLERHARRLLGEWYCDCKPYEECAYERCTTELRAVLDGDA